MPIDHYVGDVYYANEEDEDIARRASIAIEHGEEESNHNSVKVMTSSGDEVPIPQSASRALLSTLRHMSSGHDVVLSSARQELGTEEAARILGISRPYLVYQVLDTGFIPYHLVGRHRRLFLEDVMSYAQRRVQDGREAVRELTRLNQEMDLYE